MFDDKTPEAIRATILENIGESVQTREGSFVAEMVGPVATEMALIYQTIIAMLPAFYVDEGSGGFIDLACNRYGIARKTGTKATAAIHFGGRARITIPAGTVFMTADGLEFSLDETVTLADNGTGTGTVTAINVGDANNVSAGELTQMAMTLTGLGSWRNDAAHGGTDAETDAALVARLYAHWRRPGTSGNVYHYEQWALEVDGVGVVKVIRLWDGPGTVKVLIAGPNRQPVADDVVAAVAAHIEEERPTGAAVTVASARSVAIDVAVTLTLDGSTTLAAVKEALVSSLDTYLQGVAFETYSVLYNRIAYLVLDIPGVVNYTALTVNGGTANVTLEGDQVPVTGTVTVS